MSITLSSTTHGASHSSQLQQQSALLNTTVLLKKHNPQSEFFSCCLINQNMSRRSITDYNTLTNKTYHMGATSVSTQPCPSTSRSTFQVRRHVASVRFTLCVIGSVYTWCIFLAAVLSVCKLAAMTDINFKLDQLLEFSRKQTEWIAHLQKQADESASNIVRLTKKVEIIEEKLEASSTKPSDESIKVPPEVSVGIVRVWFARPDLPG